MPSVEVESHRHLIESWLQRNDQHMIHRWSDLMLSLDALPIGSRRRILIMREATSVANGPYVVVPSIQALTCEG